MRRVELGVSQCLEDVLIQFLDGFHVSYGIPICMPAPVSGISSSRLINNKARNADYVCIRRGTEQFISFLIFIMRSVFDSQWPRCLLWSASGSASGDNEFVADWSNCSSKPLNYL